MSEFKIRTGIVAEYVPPGQTINQKYYIELLLKLQEKIQRNGTVGD
jgi:hypothetical protein